MCNISYYIISPAVLAFLFCIQASSIERYVSRTSESSEFVLGVKRLGKRASRTPSTSAQFDALMRAALLDIESKLRTKDEVMEPVQSHRKPCKLDAKVVGLPTVVSKARSNKRTLAAYERSKRKAPLLCFQPLLWFRQ